MAKDDTLYVSANGSLRMKPFKLCKGEQRLLSIDWNAYLGAKSTMLTEACWEQEDSSIICIVSPTISSGVSSCEAEGCAEGSTTLKVTATLASGEVLIRKFYIRVIDPEANGGSTEYQ